MGKVITLWLGGREVHLFTSIMEIPFRDAPLHMHPYPEVHILLAGAGCYTVAGREYPLAEGDVILIPAGRPHATAAESGSRVRAFQADLPLTAERTLTLPRALVTELGEAKDPAGLAPVLYYLLAQLSEEELLTVRENDDHAYLISEYIEANYHRPIRLSELASVLHLSERQTQRELRRLYGMTFSELIRTHRMTVARRLADSGMTATVIAEYLGYETYSGYLRAKRKGIGRNGGNPE